MGHTLGEMQPSRIKSPAESDKRTTRITALIEVIDKMSLGGWRGSDMRLLSKLYSHDSSKLHNHELTQLETRVAEIEESRILSARLDRHIFNKRIRG